MGKSREIWLDKGEAYFQVRHDAAHPFVVMAMGHRVEDVGTKFVVRRRADSIEITMLDGRVQRWNPAQVNVDAEEALDVAAGDGVALRP